MDRIVQAAVGWARPNAVACLSASTIRLMARIRFRGHGIQMDEHARFKGAHKCGGMPRVTHEYGYVSGHISPLESSSLDGLFQQS